MHTVQTDLDTERSRSVSVGWLLAWIIAAGLMVGVSAAGFRVVYTNPEVLPIPEFQELLRDLSIPQEAAITGFLLVPFLGGVTLATLIFWRLRNDRGALLFALGVLGWTAFTSGTAFALSSSSPGLRSLGLYTDVLSIMAVGVAAFTFPSGRFVPKWTIPAAAAAAVLLLVDPTTLADVRLTFESQEASASSAAIMGFLFLATASAAIAQVWRYRHVSDPAERAQTRWVLFSFGAAFLMATLALLLAVSAAPPTAVAWAMLASSLVSVLAIVGVGFALFRFHLFDIDRVISRTAVYAIVVGALAAVYVAAVFVVQQLLPESSDLAVAGSTLAVAALFNPLRRRVQRFVDRRFYRSRYNAQQIVEDFANRLRNEVDLNNLVTDWISAVDRAVKPSFATVWVKSTDDTPASEPKRHLRQPKTL